MSIHIRRFEIVLPGMPRLVQFRIIPSVIIPQSLCKKATTLRVLQVVLATSRISSRTARLVVCQRKGSSRRRGKTLASLVLIHALAQIGGVSDILFAVLQTL